MADGPRNSDQIMEHTTPYSLETAIQRWRAELAQSPAFSEENLNELESHLRDLMARLQGNGLSEEEAFWVATKRVGTRPVLEKEFGKINASAVWWRRLLWMLVGIQVSRFVYMVSGSVHWSVFGGIYKFGRAYGFDLEGLAVYVSPIASLAAFFVVLWLCGKLFVRKGDAMIRWVDRRFSSRSKLLFGFFLVTLLWALVSAVGSLPQTFAMKHVPIGEVYQRFGQWALLLQINYWLEPMILLGLTFYVAFKLHRARQIAD